MSQEKTTLEIIAPTVDEAVKKGLDQLGLPADAVDVEVLDGGSRGLFGIGGRHARVRLKIKGRPETPAPAAPLPVKTKPPQAEHAKEATPAAQPVNAAASEDRTLTVSQEVVKELLEKMGIQDCSVSARYLDPEDSHDEAVVLVDVQGNDLSILIGRRSETLNALQYIASLIVGKELESWVPLMIDVQGYRSRRERALRQLARRMAEQAVHTGRRQTLEPMNASERRIVHLELRDHPQVTTESVGEEPNRKVTIILKK